MEPKSRMNAFPCPLSPFEHLMWLDDSVDYPMAFPIIGELTGDVDKKLAQEALEAICERHALLGMRVGDMRGRPHWIPVPDGTAKANAIVWREDQTVALRGLDLRVESGVRVEFLRDADRWRMAWHFHHSCCDGIGAATAIGEWLLVYDALARGRDWHATLESLDEQSLARRARLRLRRSQHSPSASASVSKSASASGAPSATSAGESLEQADLANGGDSPPAKTTEKDSLWRRLKGVASHASQAYRVVMASPAELAAGLASDAGNELKSSSAKSTAAVVRVRHWNAEQWLALRRMAESRGATVNDCLLTALMIVAGIWNQRQTLGKETRPVRVMMPTNQRISEDRGLSAANVVSYAMLDRVIDSDVNPRDLLESVQRETAAIGRQNLSRRFLMSLGMAGRWPWLMRFALRRRRSWSTAVLSNLGDVSRRARNSYRWENDRLVAGDLRLESFYGAPPLRPGTRVTLGVSVFRQRLSVAAFLDPRYFNDADQEYFLEQFQAVLADLVGGV